jgi:hypothetical protein
MIEKCRSDVKRPTFERMLLKFWRSRRNSRKEPENFWKFAERSPNVQKYFSQIDLTIFCIFGFESNLSLSCQCSTNGNGKDGIPKITDGQPRWKMPLQDERCPPQDERCLLKMKDAQDEPVVLLMNAVSIDLF